MVCMFDIVLSYWILYLIEDEWFVLFNFVVMFGLLFDVFGFLEMYVLVDVFVDVLKVDFMWFVLGSL